MPGVALAGPEKTLCLCVFVVPFFSGAFATASFDGIVKAQITTPPRAKITYRLTSNFAGIYRLNCPLATSSEAFWISGKK